MELLTLSEAATATGLSLRTLFRYREDGKFVAPVFVGSSPTIFYRADQVSAWCAAHGITWPSRNP